MQRLKSLTDKGNQVPYLVAIVAMGTMTLLAAVIILWIRPDYYNAELFVQMFGFATTITGVLLGLLKVSEGVELAREGKDIAAESKDIAAESKDVQKETHDLMNSRMEEMKKLVEELARAQGLREGEKIGRQKEVERADEVERGVQEGRDQVTEETKEDEEGGSSLPTP